MSQNIRGWRKINGEMLDQTAARWPKSQQHNVGFRLAHDGIDEHRYRRGRSFTVPGDEAMVGMVLEDFPEFQNARIGIRLTADWSRA